jgi:hypothetical protein
MTHIALSVVVVRCVGAFAYLSWLYPSVIAINADASDIEAILFHYVSNGPPHGFSAVVEFHTLANFQNNLQVHDLYLNYLGA